MQRILQNKYFGLLVVLLISFFAIKAFFAPGFFPIHDDTQIARVFEMGKSLKSGMVPVRWVDDLGFGYGYPVFSFYAPLAYYVGGILTLIGFQALAATKITMGIGILLAAVSMYFLGESLWGMWGGVFSSVFYTYATYHAVDIYVRGDVAEFWAYAFIPLVFLGIWGVYKNKSILYMFIGTVGLCGLILSHNLSALMSVPFIVFVVIPIFFFLLIKKQYVSLLRIGLILLFGIGLSAFYWLPVFPEMKYTNVLSQVNGSVNFADHFVCLGQLWHSQWGYGGSAPGCQDGLSFMLGRVYFLIIALGFLGLIFYKKNKEKSIYTIISLALFLLAIFLTLPYSKSIWDLFKFLKYLQYPWRFLLIAAFFNALIAGAAVWQYKDFLLEKLGKFFSTLVYILILCLALYTQVKFFQPQRFNGNEEDHYINYPAIQFEASSLSHEYLPKSFVIPKTANELPKEVFVPSKNITILSTSIRTANKSASITVQQVSDLVIHIAYFPAWHAFLDSKEVVLQQTSTGMQLRVSPGKHTISLVYQSTQIESVANIISLTSAGLFLLAIIYFSLKYDKKDN